MSADFDLADFYRRNYEENWEKVSNCHRLLGYYSHFVEIGQGGPMLAEMVNELKAILAGTWTQPNSSLRQPEGGSER